MRMRVSQRRRAARVNPWWFLISCTLFSLASLPRPFNIMDFENLPVSAAQPLYLLLKRQGKQIDSPCCWEWKGKMSFVRRSERRRASIWNRRFSGKSLTGFLSASGFLERLTQHMLTRPDGRLQLSSAVSTRFRSVEKMRNMLQNERETLGWLSLLVFWFIGWKRSVSYFFTGTRPSWLGCSLSLVKLVRNTTISLKSYISHSLGTMPLFGLVSPYLTIDELDTELM